jgi:predicted RNA-binding protein with PUA-like domain
MFALAVRPCGNSIKKAYLSHAVCRRMKPGDNVFFYRSEDICGITAVGIVEETFVSRKPDEIARYVGTRTVYSYADIKGMCGPREVLAILFRLVRTFPTPVPIKLLREQRVLGGQPQSITQLAPEGVEWLRRQTGL